MLDIKVTIEGNKVIIDGLQRFGKLFPTAIQRSLNRSLDGITRKAADFLTGVGAKGTSKEVTSKTGKKYLKWEKRKTPISPGGYPVPRRTGHLARQLMWLHTGESANWGEFSEILSRKVVKGGSKTAGPFEVILFNRARYAKVIHEGTHSSSQYGPRRYITDALERFNQGDRIKKIFEEEIQKARAQSFLKS